MLEINLMKNKVNMLASPALGNSRLLNFFRVNLSSADSIDIITQEQEHAIDILSGLCSIHIIEQDGTSHTYSNVGGRQNIFSGIAEFVYVPRNASYSIECITENLEVGICAVTASRDSRPIYIPKEAVQKKVSGRNDWQRDVYIGLGEGGPSTMIYIGETDSPPGNWSGFPPHTHSQNNPPHERSFEELYYFKFNPVSGFALGGVYSDDRCRKETSNISIVGDSQTFCAPSGYHFIAPCPGYKLKYIWMLGGETKGYGEWSEDPDLKWLL